MARNYELVVIGAGPGGYTAALKAAGLGMKVAVVDQERLGGVCVNRGCIPTKALLHASNIFSMMQHCDEFGVSTDFISFDFKKMQEYKKRSVRLYRQGIEKLFAENHIDFIKGTATIRREKTVEVTGEEGKEYLHADYIIIATGASPVIPDIPGIDLPGVSNSDRLLASQNWNFDRVVIIGGGVIGVEFATIFQALCSKVTIVEMGPHLLGPMDTEVALALEDQLRDKGITIHCNSTIEEITEEDGLNCRIQNHRTGEVSRIRASQVVVAVGRKPYMNRLIGEDVSLEIRNGRLSVDADFMTSEMHIYAIGDVVSKTQLAHGTGEVSRIRASQVVVAVGRKPYMNRLIGEDVSLEIRNGRLSVDADFMTSEMHIYAIGDVVSKTQLAHVAMAQGTYVVEKIAGRTHSIRLEAVPNGMYVSLPIVPNCIYTVPEIATVGITEQTANTLGMKVRCGMYDMNDNGKSIITHREKGFIRLIFEAYSNTIVGAQIVCPRATDMIGEMATAIANGLTAEQLSRAMRAHPTYSEGIAAAIEDAMREKG